MVDRSNVPILVAVVNVCMPFAVIPRVDTAIFERYQVWFFIFGRFHFGHGEAGPILFFQPLGLGSFFLPGIEIVVSFVMLGLGLFLAQILRPAHLSSQSFKTIWSIIISAAILQVLISFIVAFLFSGPWDYWYDAIIPLPISSFVAAISLFWLQRNPVIENLQRTREGD